MVQLAMGHCASISDLNLGLQRKCSKESCIQTVAVSITLPETNIAPENRSSQKERIVFQPSIFRCKLAVSFRVPGKCHCSNLLPDGCVTSLFGPGGFIGGHRLKMISA